METCRHSTELCPISHSTCPGICVYSEILGDINIGIIVFDIEKETIVYKNKVFCDSIVGLAGKDDYETLYELLVSKEFKAPAFHSPHDAQPLRYKDRIFGYSIYWIASRFMWLFVKDITDKMRLESIADTMSITNNIGYVIAGVRHEIGNPINSIKVALNVLRDNIETYPQETVIKFIDRTLDDIVRVEYLLRSLKTYNMYETLIIENIDVDLFMSRFLSLARGDLAIHNIDIRYFLHAGAEWAKADPRALQQVFLNIVANSLDALREKENPYISITIFNVGRFIQIHVEDNGCGIPEERQTDLFKPFFTSKHKGTGLGLIIAKKMLAHMDGTISMESYENLGTIVQITIPKGEEDG